MDLRHCFIGCPWARPYPNQSEPMDCQYACMACFFFGPLAIIHRFIHCLFFQVFFLKSSSNTHSSCLYKSPICRHLLQQEMMQGLSQRAVRTRLFSEIVPPGITAQTVPSLTRLPSHKVWTRQEESSVRNERNPLESNECLVNNIPQPCWVF